METAEYIFTDYPSGIIINSILCFRIITSPKYPQKMDDYSPGTRWEYMISLSKQGSLLYLSLQ